MNPQHLFLDTLEDLRRRTDLRATEYDMVQAAGLPRRLLLDDTPVQQGMGPLVLAKGCRGVTLALRDSAGVEVVLVH
jgi:hypothetical protein